MEKSNPCFNSSFHEKVESKDEGLFGPSSPNQRVIQESRKSSVSQTCTVSNKTQCSFDPDLSFQTEVKNDSIVNASLYDSFAMDESKYDSFEDSLDENAQAHISPKKINASDFLSEQVNVTLRKVRDRQKLKGSYLCDSLEDICSLVSNMDHFSSSDELENINNILEKHGICEDSLRNDICCNRNASLTDQNFDDDSLAILEAEKHFEDSLEDADVASCVDSLMILGSSIGDVEMTVDKIGTDHCGMKTSVEIIYENAPLSSDESYRTAENFISEKNSPSLSDRPMSHDSLEEIHDISEMLSEMSNVPLKTDASLSKVADVENASLPCTLLGNLSGSKVRSSEFHSESQNRFSNAESERTSSVVNSCYFYDTFCIDESIDFPSENANPKHSGFDHKPSIELVKEDEFHEGKAANEGIVIIKSDCLRNTSNEKTATAPHGKSNEKEICDSSSKTNSEIKNLSQNITPSFDLVNNLAFRPNLKDVTDTCKKTSSLPAEKGKITENPSNSEVLIASDEKVLDVKLENTLGVAKVLSSNPQSFVPQKELKEISLPLSDDQFAKQIPIISAHDKGSVSIIRKDKLNLNLQIELAVDTNQDVNIVSISSNDQKSCSEIMFLEEGYIVSECKNESKIDVFNLNSQQFKKACTVKTDIFDKRMNEAEDEYPSLPLSNKRTISKESINNYCCKYRVSPGEMPNENFSMKLDFNLPLLKALDLHDSFYDFREKCRVQSRDSIMPLNLCIRDEQLERNNEMYEGKENMPCDFKSPECKQESRKSKESVLNSGNKSGSRSRDKRVGKIPIVTKIPVRKAESSFVVPVHQKQNKQDTKTSPCSGKAKKLPLVKSTSINSIGKTTPMETPKKHHFCTVRNSICRVPKSKEKANPKKFQNIQSPVAMYIGNLRSPLRPTHQFDGNQNYTPSKTKGKFPIDANTLLSPTVKK